MKERTPPKKMATKIIKLLKKENIDDNYLKKVFEHIRGRFKSLPFYQTSSKST